MSTIIKDHIAPPARPQRIAPGHSRSRYQAFISQKSQFGSASGFDPIWIPDWLFDFQKHVVEWNCRLGRSASFADCGLGKGPMELVWGENVVRRTNRPVLVPAPLAVAAQLKREADRFGIECFHSRDGKLPMSAQVVTTNYEQLHHFNPHDFAGVACDESGILKNFDGVRRGEITEFLRTIEYRLLSTATAAPNDYTEIGTHSEALGELGYMDMLSRFFKNNKQGIHMGSIWGGGAWRFRGHAERDFWRWVCSWARAFRKPSDLGFDDGLFILPPLETEEHVVPARFAAPGRLFDTLAITREEQIEERRRTIQERCEKAASLIIGTGKPAVAWCHLNPEGDLLTRLIPGAVQVAGADPDERKEEVFLAFERGEVRVLVTKPSIAGFGLNWQHCSHYTYFPDDSFEKWYQVARRFWRFGQKSPVKGDLVSSEGAARSIENLRRKAVQAEQMFARLVEHMNESLTISRGRQLNGRMDVPAWL